ncbi:MAG TPA: hypothetical protein VM866_03940 [Pyrinomonadaceae bacterium]|nr:hypothetical protein [Pyrinomonadaceae bacterium]
MQQVNNTATHILPSSEANQRIEVSFEQHDGAERVALKYSTWTDGLGWCGQKTIRLDAGQLDELHRTLTVARHRMNRRRAEADQLDEPAQVIQLPTLARR